MAHTVIPSPRGTTATLELTHKGNINDKTIPERDREVRDFNVTLLASAIVRRRHLVIDTHRTDLGVTRQGCAETTQLTGLLRTNTRSEVPGLGQITWRIVLTKRNDGPRE